MRERKSIQLVEDPRDGVARLAEALGEDRSGEPLGVV
jgi:hypothetical protein